MISVTKKISYFLYGLSALFLFTECHNYYKATALKKNTTSDYAGAIDSLKLTNRYFVLRNGNESYYMKNTVLSPDQKNLTCTLEELSSFNKFHLLNGGKGKMQYKRTDQNQLAVLNEVHFYITPDNAAAFGQYTLPLDKVQKIEVIEKDKKRTTNSYVIGAVGYTLGAVAVVAIIIAATKSSCPFVSAYHQNDFSLQGEIYGGAIYPQLARNDYMPLKMSPLPDSTFQVKISNELKERQYTDMAELWIINHAADTKVLSDDKGNLFSISDPQKPTKAIFQNTTDVTEDLVKENDNRLLHFDDTTADQNNNSVILHFNKKEINKKANLVLALKNSYWLDYLYGELAKGFGSYYATYMDQQKKKPATELLKWISDQQIPLIVSVRKNNGWGKITAITTIGPLATREIVVPIDCSNITGDEIEIKLASGFMFWEIDYAAIDYTESNSFTIQKLSPVKAMDEVQRNVLPLLQTEDGNYLEQPQIGNIVTLVYKSMPATKDAQSFILHSKGYYEHIRDFTNKPDFAFLQKFMKPGAFASYGVEMYKKLRSSNLQMLAKNQ